MKRLMVCAALLLAGCGGQSGVADGDSAAAQAEHVSELERAAEEAVAEVEREALAEVPAPVPLEASSAPGGAPTGEATASE